MAQGELVFTSLTKEALAVIRYRTRDLTRQLPGTGPSMRRMQKVTGRDDDMMIVRGVKGFPTQIEELILKQPALAPHYQCILTREGALDCLTVAVEAAGLDPAHGDAQAGADKLGAKIKVYVGTTAKIGLRPAGGIERRRGKAKQVVEQRPR
ncbi:MAG: paaK [Ramlibacter sp.]|nr:paaK [Ramlibacter sp.]